MSSGAAATGANETYTATVTNAGPLAASNVTLTPALPSSAVLVSTSVPCSAAASQSCSRGSFASGSSVSITYTATQNTAGTLIFRAQVAGSENDPVANNNSATNSTTVISSTCAIAGDPVAFPFHDAGWFRRYCADRYRCELHPGIDGSVGRNTVDNRVCKRRQADSNRSICQASSAWLERCHCLDTCTGRRAICRFALDRLPSADCRRESPSIRPV